MEPVERINTYTILAEIAPAYPMLYLVLFLVPVLVFGVLGIIPWNIYSFIVSGTIGSIWIMLSGTFVELAIRLYDVGLISEKAVIMVLLIAVCLIEIASFTVDILRAMEYFIMLPWDIVPGNAGGIIGIVAGVFGYMAWVEVRE